MKMIDIGKESRKEKKVGILNYPYYTSKPHHSLKQCAKQKASLPK